MSKTSMCFEMLKLLNAYDIISKGELAVLLETNERNIIEYKNELESCGYQINVIPGKFGGYSLNKESLMPSLALTENEKESLEEAFHMLNKSKSFLHEKDLSSAIGKILQNKVVSNKSANLIIERFPLIMSKEELESRYNILETAINKKIKVLMQYKAINGKVNEFILHPYTLYNYNLGWYVLGFIENKSSTLSNKPYYYKLNRIDNIKLLNEHFSPIITFKPNEYLNNYGMTKIGKLYRIKAILSSPYNTLVQERIFGDNQEIKIIDASHTLLECDMRGLDNIKAFMLYFGSCAKLLEPKEIVDEIIIEEKKMLSQQIAKKTIFFDFNGTIIDDLDLCLNILNKMLSENGYNTVTKERYLDIFGFPIEKYYEKAGFDFSKVDFKELSNEFIELYQKPSLNCALHIHAKEALEKANELGYNVVLLTASEKKNVTEQLEHFGLLKYFNAVLGIDNIYASSKVQIGIDYIKNYNLDKATCYMVGDTDHDVLVANSMGINVISYTKGHQSKERLAKINDNLVDDLLDIFDIIK